MRISPPPLVEQRLEQRSHVHRLGAARHQLREARQPVEVALHAREVALGLRVEAHAEVLVGEALGQQRREGLETDERVSQRVGERLEERAAGGRRARRGRLGHGLGRARRGRRPGCGAPRSHGGFGRVRGAGGAQAGRLRARAARGRSGRCRRLPRARRSVASSSRKLPGQAAERMRRRGLGESSRAGRPSASASARSVAAAKRSAASGRRRSGGSTISRPREREREGRFEQRHRARQLGDERDPHRALRVEREARRAELDPGRELLLLLARETLRPVEAHHGALVPCPGGEARRAELRQRAVPDARRVDERPRRVGQRVHDPRDEELPRAGLAADHEPAGREAAEVGQAEIAEAAREAPHQRVALAARAKPRRRRSGPRGPARPAAALASLGQASSSAPRSAKAPRTASAGMRSSRSSTQPARGWSSRVRCAKSSAAESSVPDVEHHRTRCRRLLPVSSLGAPAIATGAPTRRRSAARASGSAWTIQQRFGTGGHRGGFRGGVHTTPESVRNPRAKVTPRRPATGKQPRGSWRERAASCTAARLGSRPPPAARRGRTFPILGASLSVARGKHSGFGGAEEPGWESARRASRAR